jgi:hypothetical protein
MGVTKVSVTVDADMLREVRRIAGKDISLSSIVDESLRRQLQRMRMLALLDEMDKHNPISPTGLKSGEALWQRIESSSTRVHSPRSRRKKKTSA